MDDIASALSISKRTLYELFGDKQSLIYDVLNHYEAERKRKIAELTKDAENLFDEIFIVLRNWQRDTQECRYFMITVEKYYPQVFAKYSDAVSQVKHAEFRRLIEKGKEEGLLLDNVDYDMSIYILSVTMKALLAAHTKSDKSDLDDMLKHVIIYFFRAYASEKGVTVIDDYINNRI